MERFWDYGKRDWWKILFNPVYEGTEPNNSKIALILNITTI
jgi:hypothetical protein